MKQFTFGFILTGLLLFVASCGDKNDSPKVVTVANRTVLVYIMGENSLSSEADKDISEMKNGLKDLPKDGNLLVFCDKAYANPFLMNLYLSKSGEVVCDTVFKAETNLCSTDPAILEKMLGIMTDKYKAQHYGLVLWSHGSGMLPASVKQNSRSIGQDNGNNTTSNSGPQMDIIDLRNLLEDFIRSKDIDKFDFILFDACFMQGIEVAYELRNCADYIIGSVAEIPGPGAPYMDMIKPFFATSFDADAVVKAYYNNYISNPTYGVAISAVETAKLDNLAQVTSKCIQSLSSFSLSLKGVNYYYPKRLPPYYDLMSLFKQNLNAVDFQLWYSALKEAVPYSYTTGWIYSDYIKGPWKFDVDEYGGVSTYLQQISNPTLWNTYYNQLEWSSDSGMDQLK